MPRKKKDISIWPESFEYFPRGVSELHTPNEQELNNIKAWFRDEKHSQFNKWENTKVKKRYSEMCDLRKWMVRIILMG